MSKSLREIADWIKGELRGDPSIRIRGIAGIENAQAGDLTFLAHPKYVGFLKTTLASAVIVGPDTKIEEIKIPSIIHPHPYYALAKTLELFYTVEKPYPEQVHPTAVLAEGVRLERGVHIGANVVLDKGVWVKPDTVILAGCFVGADTVIGENSFIYPNVTIRENVEVGNRVIVHSGTVIGADGFGYVKYEGIHHKIPQVGKVRIEDNVEIGANVTIDRATLGFTRIGRGTKIDNLVQIGHNVEIGENCIIVAQVGIGGSAKIGNDTVIAGQAGLTGHIKIGNRVTIGAQSGVTKSIPDDATVFGYPAREIHKMKRIEAHLSHLDSYIRRLRELEELVNKN
jgi:UDP-3-O-[3-hydroxymyristoyl] glucosamine N-acyltransferase